MEKNFTKTQLWMLVILRISIGWHFLYEGIVKVTNPDWSSLGFLLDSKGLFDGIFHSMANNASMVSIINYMNIWGLILIGLSLIAGLLNRPAIISAIVLLAFYYLSHPPLIGVEYLLPSEGSYLFVNKNLIELFALSVILVFPTSRIIGLDRLVFGKVIVK
jgi:thiosulfate dehydrogenase [quinone] large subunit